MCVTNGLHPPHLLCDRGAFCDLAGSHEGVSSDAVDNHVLAFPALIAGALTSVMCVLSFYNSNNGGEEMTSRSSQGYKLSVASE